MKNESKMKSKMKSKIKNPIKKDQNVNVWCILLPSLLVPSLSEALKLKSWTANTEKISVRSRSGWNFQTFCTHWNFSDLAHKKARSLGCGSHVRSRRNKPSCRSCWHTLAYAEGHWLYTGGRWLPGLYSGIAGCVPRRYSWKTKHRPRTSQE